MANGNLWPLPLLLILCVGLAYGLALSPSDPLLPYKAVIQSGAASHEADEKPVSEPVASMFEITSSHWHRCLSSSDWRHRHSMVDIPATDDVSCPIAGLCRSIECRDS